MKITVTGLTAEYSYNDTELLNDWTWLVGEDISVLCITKMGDVFIQKPNGIYFLSTVFFTFDRIAGDVKELQTLAAIKDNFNNWFMPDVINGQKMVGQEAMNNQCLSMKLPLILGGEFVAENIEVTGLAVHISMAGQIYRQVKNLPPGTKINDIVIQ